MIALSLQHWYVLMYMLSVCGEVPLITQYKMLWKHVIVGNIVSGDIYTSKTAFTEWDTLFPSLLCILVITYMVNLG